jgi:hypothetical protein
MPSLLVFNSLRTEDTVNHDGIFDPSCEQYRGTCVHTVCNRGGGEGIGASADKLLPLSTFTCKFLRKADI